MRGALAAAGVQFDQDQKPILSVPVPPPQPRVDRSSRGPRVPAGQPIRQQSQQQPVAPAGQAAAIPIPRTPDNQIDGSKLQAGQRYVSSDGTVKTWNSSTRAFE
jgi:hypothetical protein